MYSLGGALLASHDRAATPLDPEITALVRQRRPDRALVVGGFTSALGSLLAELGTEITVLDPRSSEDGALAAVGRSHVESLRSWDDLADLPSNWHDVVVVLGGTVETGADLAPVDSWSRLRRPVIAELVRVRAQHGALLFDTSAGLAPGIEYCVAVGVDQRTLTTGCIVAPDGHSAMLLHRTARYDPDGVLRTETLRQFAVVPLGGDDDVIEGARRLGTSYYVVSND